MVSSTLAMTTFKYYCMLFYLSNSLIFEDSDADGQDIMLSVMNLVNQAINRIHFLLGDYDAICFFRNKFKGTAFIGTFFNSIYQNWATESVPSFINYYIEVTRSDNSTSENEGIIVNRISYNNFMDNDRLQSTIVLGEHYNDAEFFEHILNFYISKNVRNANYSMHPMPGNGKQTKDIIRKELALKHLLVCIVDTDKKYPTDTPKADSTYSLCAAIPQNQIYHFMALEVHEVENLIPLNYIDNLPWSQYNSADRVNKKHFDYLRNDANHILPYYDYKSGIRKNQELLSSQEYMAFAEECFNLDEELTNQYHSFSAYVSTKNNKDELLYKLFSGSFLITHTLEMIKGHSQPTEPELLPFQEHNWNMIGNTLLNWCIAESKDAMI